MSTFLVLCWQLTVHGPPALAASHVHKVCNGSSHAGYARCFSDIVNDPTDTEPLAMSRPQGYGPATFKAAYGDRGNAATSIGIVVAYNAPNLVNDVASYSQQYGLPALPVCRAAEQTSCISKLSQTGDSDVPANNPSWAVETSLDTEMAHAMCPGCRLNVIEANSSAMADLATATQAAAALGSKVISNSYGGPESSGEAAYDRYYNKSGVTYVVSSGDSGYGVNYPASSPGVVAVGGTTLAMSGARLLSETAWSGAGSGCSSYEYKPTWQKDSRCHMRSVADVAADADPSTGAAVYDSYLAGRHSGWFTVGGTSLAAPLVAGMLANSGQTKDLPASLYASTGALRDITSGTNGSCSLSYLCRATSGYDGPTGLGVLSKL